MVTKNELVAIIAALTTDYDTPPTAAEADPQQDEAQNDAFMDSNDAVHVEHRKRAV